MKNKNYKVFYLTLSGFLIYFAISIASFNFNISWTPFNRINLISEIFKNKEHPASPIQTLVSTPKTLSHKDSAKFLRDFNLYQQPKLITNFEDKNKASLPSLMSKLQRLKNGEKIKIRIAYFGDSMIEGDLLTQTLRSLLQKEYGGRGVGYLPIYSKVASFRQTASVVSENWEDTNFMVKGAKNLYLSGHYYTGKGHAKLTDNTLQENSLPIEKSILYSSTTPSKLTCDGAGIDLPNKPMVGRHVLVTNTKNTIDINSNSANTKFYGVSFESEHGVILDNFSFRGITGIELNKLSEEFMASVQEANQYDLIVLQYGVNMLFRPNDTNYDYYSDMMEPVIKKLKNAFSNTEILMVSSADRAFKYNDEYKTAIGLPKLIETQANLAFNHQLTFYNLFETMGGTNSIVDWATRNPALANKDYIHPNHKGAEVLAHKMYEAFQNDYVKYTAKKK